MSSEIIITGPPAKWRERLAGLIYVVMVLCGALGLVGLVAGPRTAWDDTDGAGQRSGMVLLTDYGTGCEYLARPGAQTPRLDGTGRQKGCRP